MAALPPRGEGAFSEHLYRLLLLAYPRPFREEYASEMVLLFRDAYQEASRQQRALGVLRFWSNVLVDLAKSAGVQWLTHWTPADEHDLALAGKEQLAVMTLQFKLNVAQRTDVGRKRASNEDNLVSVVPEEPQLLQDKGALFVVADGWGDSHERGEAASELTIQHIRDVYYQNRQDDIPPALQKAIRHANEAIYRANEAEHAQGNSEFDMGATCVAAVLHEQKLYAANIGDSRVYVLHEGHLRQVTRDHSLVARMVERGEITPAQVRTHEKRDQIYRSLGVPEVEVDLFTETVQEGDTLLLCTDGLWVLLEDDEMRAIIEGSGLEESAPHLITRANEAGGTDNITAIVVRVSAA
jgi:serine/threonine protein phosphatase PrpC